jgi:tetratricopeptide (TPR) repeat protein
LTNQSAAFRKSNFSSIFPLGDISGEGAAYGNIAVALISLSRYDKAIEYEQKRLEIAQQTGDISGEGRAYNNMGLCMSKLGRVQEAIEMHKKDLEICLQTGEL